MAYLEFSCFLAGLLALVVGYRRHKRNLLLIGAFAWLLAGGLGDFSQGLADGLATPRPSLSHTK
ncbi:hypothetical protein ISN76_18795 [Dyella halodurans]|uniref:Uncharacterized protein n=1 Tax=Dyella halodurans TaxID=1920171 RepID=A0ABV9C8U6_9GAMM|nr:hypothetical protein [Dyella halodurans]